MNHEKPNALDFMKALELLYPYKAELETIHQAEQDGEFDDMEITDPWSAISYFRSSKAYETYHVNHLAHRIYQSIKELKVYPYSNEMYERIQMFLAVEETGSYEKWTLEEVYIYLTMIFEDIRYNEGGIDEITIENVIINGELLRIMECFLIRI